MIEQETTGKLSLLRLNRPPLNTIDDALLTALCEAVSQGENDSEVAAIVLTGDPEHFSAGADIHAFEDITSANDACQLSRRFQEAFQKIEDCTKPVVCALAGNVMGGALELAMACHRRIATPDARFSLPEIRLAILPGAGGTQRLPRLVGPHKALEMMLTGKAISASEAHELGLIDAVCPSDEIEACANSLIASDTRPRQTRERIDRFNEDTLCTALEVAERLIQNHPPEVIAPRRIVDCVTTGLRGSFVAGILAEREAFAECMQTAAAKNRIYAFFATRQTAKLPELKDVATRNIERAAVVGMGSMGTGIAQALASAGVPVTVFDQSSENMKKAIGRIRQSIERRVASGRLTEDKGQATLARITTASDFQAIGDVDLVIESVFEMLEVKRDVLHQIESVCTDDTILATNTSTLSLDSLADVMSKPDRLIGMHFFNPAHSMPLVEIIRRKHTSDDVVATSVQFAKRLRKTPVLVNNREGFLVNRVFVPYLVEAFALLEEGAAAREIDAAMIDFGFPMGPLTLSDMTGIDIVVHAHRELHKAFPYHGPLAELAHQLVAMGRTGQKSGAGVYRYEPGNRDAMDDDKLAQIVAKRATPMNSPFSRDEIRRRLVGRMVAEAFRVLEENVARSEADLDAAMVLGTGFPDYRGGIVRHARDRGLDTILQELENLSSTCSERYAPSKHLQELAQLSH